MTLVSHRKRFIFLKTHKTAGTSVEVALEPLCAPADAETGAHYRDALISEAGIIGARGGDTAGQVWKNHMSARSVRRLLGRRVWARYVKIATVRNPYPRMVSMFHSRMSTDERIEVAEASFDEVRRRFLRWLEGRWLSNNLGKLTIGSRYVIDHVVYFERLEEDWPALAQGLGLSAAPLPRLKSGRNLRAEPWMDYYDEAGRNLVERGSAFELAFFGYRFAASEAGGPCESSAALRALRVLRSDPKRALGGLRPPGRKLAFRVDAAGPRA